MFFVDRTDRRLSAEEHSIKSLVLFPERFPLYHPSMPSYFFEPIQKNLPFTEARDFALRAIEAQGFSVVSGIPVSDKIQAKLGCTFPNYGIIGFCSAKIARALIMADPMIGLQLPCTCIVRSISDDISEIAVVDMVQSLSVALQANPALEAPLNEANELISKLHEVLKA
ncbi:hypothetical protein RCL1_000141 [Eukaryota sp. TZLM3-RCL]